jgi:hypothetical protein
LVRALQRHDARVVSGKMTDMIGCCHNRLLCRANETLKRFVQAKKQRQRSLAKNRQRFSSTQQVSIPVQSTNRKERKELIDKVLRTLRCLRLQFSVSFSSET